MERMYKLTNKGKALLIKPKHEQPTNWEHCCSCCPVLEKENKELKQRLEYIDDKYIKLYNKHVTADPKLLTNVHRSYKA